MQLEYTPTNRQKSRAPKFGKAWCVVCDMYLGPVCSKCQVCKRKPHKRRLKKDTNAR